MLRKYSPSVALAFGLSITMIWIALLTGFRCISFANNRESVL